jgi:hypothetical protein
MRLTLLLDKSLEPSEPCLFAIVPVGEEPGSRTSLTGLASGVLRCMPYTTRSQSVGPSHQIFKAWI